MRSVITVPVQDSIGLISGWEAANLKDVTRPKKVLSYFDSGSTRGDVLTKLKSGLPLNEIIEYVNSLPYCETKTHFFALIKAGYDFSPEHFATKHKVLSAKEKQRINLKINKLLPQLSSANLSTEQKKDNQLQIDQLKSQLFQRN